MHVEPRPVVIVGPTAGGKTELAIELAQRLGPAQILSADSMQVYRHLDAGTAKPSPAERAQVPHHLIDIVEPAERFTLADWLSRATALIGQLQQQGIRSIIVGGTNLYLKALLEGMFEGPAEDPQLRAQLAEASSIELHRQLARVDPQAAGRIHANDRKKLIRALEVYQLTGQPISQLQTQWQASRQPGEYRFGCSLVGLDWPTEAINQRINQRVRMMFEPGPGQWPSQSLPDEVRQLLQENRFGPQSSEALGYKQVIECIRGRCTLDHAQEQTKILTRQFAKKQRTWLRRFVGAKWLPAAELSSGERARVAARFISGE